MSILHSLTNLLNFLLLLRVRDALTFLSLFGDFFDDSGQFFFERGIEWFFVIVFWFWGPGLIVGILTKNIRIWRSLVSIRVWPRFVCQAYIKGHSRDVIIFLHQKQPSLGDFLFFWQMVSFFNIHRFRLHMMPNSATFLPILPLFNLGNLFIHIIPVFFELQRDNFDKIFSNNTKSIMHESKLPCYFLSSIFSKMLIDLKVHVTIHHFIRIDILIFHWLFSQTWMHYLFFIIGLAL